MASAADRVPTEIWEQVLIDCELTTRELFRLQGVSKSFYRTINGSTPLLRIMEIVHKPVEEKRHRIPNPVLWTSHLEFRPFKYRIEVLAPASPRNGGNRWNINVHVELDMASEARATNSTVEYGIKSNKRCFSDVLDGSWRRMKITRFPVVVGIPMRIYYLDMYYEEKVCDDSGQMTLGDLADILDGVHDRSKEQHQEKVQQWQATNRETDARKVENNQCQVS